jgi:acetyl-CoA carboxylase carboxyltransferase component
MASQSHRRRDTSNREEGSVPEMPRQSEHSRQDVKRRAKERIQLDFSADALSRLERLKNLLDTSTRAEVIRLALRLLEWFATEVPGDAMITVTDREEKLIAKFNAKLLYGSKE